MWLKYSVMCEARDRISVNAIVVGGTEDETEKTPAPGHHCELELLTVWPKMRFGMEVMPYKPILLTGTHWSRTDVFTEEILVVNACPSQ